MVLTFSIEYQTRWGEEIRVCGTPAELGSNIPANALLLHTTDGVHWQGSIPVTHTGEITYYYLLTCDGVPVREEWNLSPRMLWLPETAEKNFYLYDSWKEQPENSCFYSSPFSGIFPREKEEPGTLSFYSKTILLQTDLPVLPADCRLAVIGNTSQLGNWHEENPLLLNNSNFPTWQFTFNAEETNFPLEYKFVLWHQQEKRVVMWEESSNRILQRPAVGENEVVLLTLPSPYFSGFTWKGAGVAIPVFSLRSEKSFGIGDFGDLTKMVDWAALTGQKAVQILPVNDTTMTHTWMDSYPYNSISIYALNPVYMDLSRMGKLNDPQQADYYAAKQKELNALQQVDFESVSRHKWDYFRLLYRQEGMEVMTSDTYRKFYENNHGWLKPYAVYSYLRDLYQTPDYQQWPQYTTYNAEEMEELCAPGTDTAREIGFYYYIQYHLHTQLSDAALYAARKGVILKGDIPIGISRTSVEAWAEPHYFNMDGQAGAPPDDFSVNGQNWGFPTYNWFLMKQDGYDWWKKRFRKMAEYFSAYRIDHILGFFRIWEIPMDSVHGLLGYFSPALPYTRQEIEAYGLPFYEDFYLNPYIHEQFLPDIFGKHTQYVIANYLETTDTWQVYRMREAYNTQRKVQEAFRDKNDPDSILIRDGLYHLISNVLFIRDPRQTDRFHPRIAVQEDYIYCSLSQPHKDAFNRLYDDFYYRRHNEFWKEQALDKLPGMIGATRMLVCGEDLGMVPDCVPEVMNLLQILSLEIERMPKNPGYEFGVLQEYPYHSVCTISTHDMSTLRGWWKENPLQTQRYYEYVLHREGEAPAEATPEICEEVVKNHLASPSVLAILTLQDWFSINGEIRNPDIEIERINIPSNPRHYWRWRMHITLEELLRADGFNYQVASLIRSNGREV